MSRAPISRDNAEHYGWTGENGGECDGWFLLRTPEMAIIEEWMPPRSSETRHYHLHARQFFYVLEGTLTLEIAGAEALLSAGKGIEVVPREPHQVFNRGDVPVRFLVVSHPPSHVDRVNLASPKETTIGCSAGVSKQTSTD